MGKLRQGEVKNLPRVIQAELGFEARQQSLRVPSRSKPLPLAPKVGRLCRKRGQGNQSPPASPCPRPSPCPQSRSWESVEALRTRQGPVAPGHGSQRGQAVVAYPQLPVIVVGPQELHDVGVVTGGEDLNLHDVVLQLLLILGLNYFGGSQGTCLLVLGLQSEDTEGQQPWSAGSWPLEASSERPTWVGNRGQMSRCGWEAEVGGTLFSTMASARSLCQLRRACMRNNVLWLIINYFKYNTPIL